jgi:hypothetical protein
MSIRPTGLYLFLLIIVIGGGVAGLGVADMDAQVVVSATPARISIPSATVPGLGQPDSTVTVTRTPTPIGPILLEAKPDAGAVNVRSRPDPESDRLGTIQAGDLYPVTGRFFRWLQFQYDVSPNGVGWVFEELVTLIGDETAIPDLNAATIPTVDTSILNVTQTWEAVLQTPGGILTATAEARILAAPGIRSQQPAPDAPLDEIGGDLSVLPTFTYPPNLELSALTQSAVQVLTPTTGQVVGNIDVSDGVAPIVPILGFGVLGLLGLAISAIRN